MIIVVGAGVAGLSCAATLLEAGHEVEIWTRQRPPHTTSNVAAAFWYPYRAFPEDLVTRWSAASYRRFLELAEQPDTGVSLRRAYDLARRPLPRPWWADAVPTLRQATAPELPPGFTFGWVFEAPVIDTRRYLPWLMDLVESQGCRIVRRTVQHLDEVFERADTVIHCAGLGARELAHDPEVHPIRGQLLHIANPGLQDVVLDEHDDGSIAYVVPRGDDCVLGGTAEVGDDDLHPRPDDARRIREGCSALVPRVAEAPALADTVGLRPGRSTVRLEAIELSEGRLLVHDYGHGGAGVTLSWGCAEDVTALVAELRA